MILFLSAHPDDAELGAGATISGMKDKIGFCLTAHSAFKHLLPEMLKAWQVLGIEYLIQWDQGFKHREFDRQQVLDTFIRLRDYYRPALVFTHSSFDCHPDHKVVYEESIRAFKHSTILGYDLPWNNVTGSDFRYYRKVNVHEVQKKRQALKCYESQAHRTYFEPEFQRAQMVMNGQACNSLYAERFELIRYVDNGNSI